MSRKVITWTMAKMVDTIARRLNNKFDAVIIIEGSRGLGKSTLAIHLARRIAKKFKEQGSEDYRFNWRNSLIYTKKETKQFLHKWRSIGIADELINVAFNRDFYNSEQKDIIKLVNMNRDHCNLFISCVPSFATLDSQLKNLCSIRITVVRRGMCIIQSQNRTIYVKDKWDQATNEKIERGWLMKGIKNPHYTKLTTFRGVMKFPPLREKSELKYQKVKDKKRNLVAKEEMGITSEKDKESDPVQIAIKMLKEGKVKNGTFLDGLAQGHGMKCSTFKDRIRRDLKDKGEAHQLANYYWDKKEKRKDVGAVYKL